MPAWKIAGPNASDFARTLLKEMGGLGGLDRAHVKRLQNVPGLGLAKVAQIKAAFELGKRLCAGKLTAPAFESSEAVADHFRARLTGRSHEAVIKQPTCWLENFLKGLTRIAKLTSFELTDGLAETNGQLYYILELLLLYFLCLTKS